VEQVWHAAREHKDGWADVALTAMRDHEVQEMRFDLSLVSPAKVVEQAEEVSLHFTRWRDLVGAGSRQEDENFERAWSDYKASRSALLQIMRDTLNTKS
jgi:hypothetical protein